MTSEQVRAVRGHPRRPNPPTRPWFHREALSTFRSALIVPRSFAGAFASLRQHGTDRGGIFPIAHKLLVNDWLRYLALLVGIIFAVFLMIEMPSPFAGILMRAGLRERRRSFR
jgi:hypothetical protein